jgi:hypothetical protein
VEETQTKYGIGDDDVFNFDETGFMMGMISNCMVVTNAERLRSRARVAQSGNPEWVPVIQGASARGWAIPPFIIVAGRFELSNWFDGRVLPQDWVPATTHNRWTNNVEGLTGSSTLISTHGTAKWADTGCSSSTVTRVTTPWSLSSTARSRTFHAMHASTLLSYPPTPRC